MRSYGAQSRVGRRRSEAAVALLGLLVLAVVMVVPAGPAAAGGSAPARIVPAMKVTKVGTVNVRDLPAAHPTGNQVALPALRFNPAAYDAAKATPSGSAVGDESISKKPTVSVGTKLASALSSNDDPRYTPPDMGFGVGGGFKMEQINTTGRIWNAGNAPGLAFDLSTFYLSGGDMISDPWVFFDQASGRWFAAIFDISLSSERLAVSATSDPTGLFHVYNIPEGPAGGCPDQGKLGVSDNVVALSANEFSSCFVSPVFQGVIITVLNKAELVAGAPLIDSAQTAPLPYSSSVVPAQSMNSTTTQWYAGVDDTTSTVAHVVKTVGTPPATVTLSEPFKPAIKKLTTPPNATQQGTGTKLDSGDNRVQTVAWQSDLLSFTNGDGCVPKHDSSTRACVRVLVISTGTGLVKVDADTSKKNEYFFYPTVRPNASGTIVVGYGRSSASLFPELDVTAAGPTGKFAKPKTIQTGDAPNQTTRYGDYFAVAIDPSAPANAWVAGEIGGHNMFGSGGWATAVAQIIVSP
jgi:hypothetical protein